MWEQGRYRNYKGRRKLKYKIMEMYMAKFEKEDNKTVLYVPVRYDRVIIHIRKSPGRTIILARNSRPIKRRNLSINQ